MDGRRHSVDVPISRALTALKRVRSLRDPSTNSMSRLSTLVDSLNWETHSNNAITLGFASSPYNCTTDKDIPGWRSLALFSEDKQHLSDHELYYGSASCKSDAGPLSLDMVSQNIERYCEEYGDKSIEFALPAPSNDGMEGGGSCNEPDEISTQPEKRRRGGSKSKCRKHWHNKHGDGLSRITAADVLSRASSPCLSIDETPKGGARMSFHRNEDGGIMDSCHQGCGISSCWSRTLKFKEPNPLHDVEEEPLLLYGESKHNAGVSTYMESPRSLCHKFMPKSFSELVGQNIVATSLLNSISNRQIAPLYLFYGPRGTGKTSASRIFAAALNCLSPEIGTPCGICQQCVLFFSGKSRDVKEIDSVRVNRIERCKSFMKNARVPPVFSRFKVYVIDECHLLHRETWDTILNNIEGLPRHVVFVMVTPNFDKLPHSVVSNSQRYHFQKVKEVDIATLLGKICVLEGIEFDKEALNFIARKSNGSLRDAEMTLDQLSLLGKKITVSLVYEVNGVVSDDELLELLHLALSSDASNTVKKARELMSSRIDPLQLASQLASLIMDILAGKCPDGVSEVTKKLFGTDNSEADMQQLSHALKILSQTEKQLRMSKNQTTWLTAALLQLSSGGSPIDASDAKLSMRHSQDGDFQSTTSTGESLKLPRACTCQNIESGKMGIQEDKETLELVWKRAIGMCKSSSLKKFLQKHGNLVSIHLTQGGVSSGRFLGELSNLCISSPRNLPDGIAVAELEFDRSNYVTKAEKSWKIIASALQHTLSYNVELRINLSHNNSSSKHDKLKKPSFTLFNCSRRVHLKSAECSSENSGATPTTVDKYVETCSSECGSHTSRTCCHGKDLFKTIRNKDGNALSTGVGTPNVLLQDSSISREAQSGAYTLNEGSNNGCPSFAFNSRSKTGAKEFLKLHCWKTAMFPFRKAWKLRHQPVGERMVDYTLHYAAAN